MKRYFTQYWANRTCNDSVTYGRSGKLLDHTAGNRFREHGVEAGDTVYVVTVRQGRLFLVGRMSVWKVCDEAEAVAALDYDPWEARDHILAACATRARFDFEVPLEVTKRLLFQSSKFSKPPLFIEPGVLDHQTLRGVRELDPASARLLDELLPSDERIFHSRLDV
jgi:hypothetical protein